MTIPDGKIECGAVTARWFCFVPQLYTPDSYLWKCGNEIIISLISTRRQGRGDLRLLIERIEAYGYTVAIPTPLARMQKIIERLGFLPTIEQVPEMGGDVNVWRRSKAAQVG